MPNIICFLPLTDLLLFSFKSVHTVHSLVLFIFVVVCLFLDSSLAFCIFILESNAFSFLFGFCILMVLHGKKISLVSSHMIPLHKRASYGKPSSLWSLCDFVRQVVQAPRGATALQQSLVARMVSRGLSLEKSCSGSSFGRLLEKQEGFLVYILIFQRG